MELLLSWYMLTLACSSGGGITYSKGEIAPCYISGDCSVQMLCFVIYSNEPAITAPIFLSLSGRELSLCFLRTNVIPAH